MEIETRINNSYSAEFKTEVLRRVEEVGKISQVAREYGLADPLVRYWVKKFNSVNSKAVIRTRIKALQRELVQLRINYRNAA